jgi:hypothetical protein
MFHHPISKDSTGNLKKDVKWKNHLLHSQRRKNIPGAFNIISGDIGVGNGLIPQIHPFVHTPFQEKYYIMGRENRIIKVYNLFIYLRSDI